MHPILCACYCLCGTGRLYVKRRWHLMQVLMYAAETGHTDLALKAWECMEYAILPSELPQPGALVMYWGSAMPSWQV